MIHREWCLQAGVRRFVERAVPQPHEFAAHDRHAPRGRFSHMYEKGRGVRKGWPDTELALPDFTFRCELKWPPNKPDAEQTILIAKLNLLGTAQRCAWADSVYCYGVVAAAKGVPLHANWRTIATHEDALVAAEIRKQEAKSGKAPRKPAERPTASRVAKVNKIRERVLF